MSEQGEKRRLNAVERRASLVERGVITSKDASLLSAARDASIGCEIENPIGFMAIPVGVAGHFVVNDRVIEAVPMATEERSIIAAASKAAKLAKPLGGFAVVSPIHAIARGHLLYSFPSFVHANEMDRKLRQRLLGFVERLREEDALEKHGGGLLRVSSDVIPLSDRSFVVVRISINPAEAMGANVVTRIGVRLSDMIKKVFRRDAVGTICTNHRSGWEVEVSASWSCAAIGGTRVRRMLSWHEFAKIDNDRAVTNNKGIMNGVTAVALATCQDTRAIEACIHAMASNDRRYMPLANYWVDAESDVLHGEMSLFLPVATKGGMTSHPQAVVYRKLMGATSARELACIMAAVGLAQNFGALYCLAGEGIPAAHAALARSR